MEILTSSDLNTYFDTVVPKERALYAWQKSRLVVVIGQDGHEHLEARELSFLEQIGALFNGQASLRRVVEYCDVNGLRSDKLYQAVNRYNNRHFSKITYKEGIANAISTYIGRVIYPKFQPEQLMHIVKKKHLDLYKGSADIADKDLYDIYTRITPAILGICIFFNQYCEKKKLKGYKIFNIIFDTNTRVVDLIKSIQKKAHVKDVVCLRKDLYKHVWVPYTPDEDDELWEPDRFAIGIVDSDGNGTVYKVPAVPA